MREKSGDKKLVEVRRSDRGLYVVIRSREWDLTGGAFSECSWQGPLVAPHD